MHNTFVELLYQRAATSGKLQSSKLSVYCLSFTSFLLSSGGFDGFDLMTTTETVTYGISSTVSGEDLPEARKTDTLHGEGPPIREDLHARRILCWGLFQVTVV